MSNIMPNRSSIVKNYFRNSSYPLKHLIDWPRPERPPRRIPEERALTIAAGFKFEKGVLICADTEITQGWSKYRGQKIFAVTFGGKQNPGPKVAFAIAGWVPYAKRAIAVCQEHISKIHLKTPRQLTNEGIRSCIADGLEKFHRKHIYKHPHYGTDAGPSVEFLIGAWSHVTGRPSLFSTSEAVVNEVPDFGCIGIGSYFARYVGNGLYRHDLPLRKIVLLATHLLRQTKNNVPSCGQESQFMTLQVGGEMSPIADFEIATSEVYSEKFVMLFNSMLLDIGDLETDFNNTMERFKNGAMAVRAQTDIANQNHQSLIRFLLFQAQEIDARKAEKERKKTSTSSPSEPVPPPEQSGSSGQE
jgi:20S proteasome alpha/beta subunit